MLLLLLLLLQLLLLLLRQSWSWRASQRVQGSPLLQRLGRQGQQLQTLSAWQCGRCWQLQLGQELELWSLRSGQQRRGQG